MVLFLVNSILFGIALAMDAFTVSISNGLAEPGMGRGRMAAVAGTYAGFQIAMPLIGWALVHTLVSAVEAVLPFIPWIAFGLLLFIGLKMIFGGMRGGDAKEIRRLSAAVLFLQGVATSIDAQSVGLTIADLEFPFAQAEALIIGAVTFLICMGGLAAGKKLGTKIAGRAEIAGGLILIGIGVEILLRGII